VARLYEREAVLYTEQFGAYGAGVKARRAVAADNAQLKPEVLFYLGVANYKLEKPRMRPTSTRNAWREESLRGAVRQELSGDPDAISRGEVGRQEWATDAPR